MYWYEQTAPRCEELVAGGVAAMSRTPGSMDVFWVGPSSSIEGAERREGPNARWKRYTVALPGLAAVTTRIAAVSRKPNTMEIWWLPTGH